MESNETKQESKVKQLKQNRLVVSREKGWVDVTSEGGQKVQTSNYKINKPCGYNLQHGDQSLKKKKDGNLLTRDTLYDLLKILLFLQIRVIVSKDLFFKKI